MSTRQEWTAIICAAVVLVAIGALAGHHVGVSQGIGEAALIRDEARVSRDYCSNALDWAQETVYATLAAQETLRAMHGHETTPTYAEEDR